MSCSYCCLNFVEIQCWPHEILGIIFHRVNNCFPPRFELWVTGSMQHIQFEEKKKVTAANENAALPDLNCGGIKLMESNFDIKDMTRPTYKTKKNG